MKKIFAKLQEGAKKGGRNFKLSSQRPSKPPQGMKMKESEHFDPYYRMFTSFKLENLDWNKLKKYVEKKLETKESIIIRIKRDPKIKLKE